MLNGSIEYTLPPNLWYTFDGRPLRGVEVLESGKNTPVNLKAFRLMSGGLITQVKQKNN